MRKNNFINAVLDCLRHFLEFVIVFILLASKHNLLFFLPSLYKIWVEGAFVVDFVCVKCVCIILLFFPRLSLVLYAFCKHCDGL